MWERAKKVPIGEMMPSFEDRNAEIFNRAGLDAAQRIRYGLAEGKQARQLETFIIGGITHVKPRYFEDHIGLFNAIKDLLQFRYGVNVKFALLNNETALERYPSKMEKASACYEVDVASVRQADFIISVFTAPSPGTGQEMTEAYLSGKPVFAVAMDENGSRKTLNYYVQDSAGKVERKSVLTGAGGISLMVDGNPAIVDRVIYPGPKKSVRRYYRAWNKLSYLADKHLGIDLYGKTGGFVRRIIDFVEKKANEGITYALSELDMQLQKHLWLKPRDAVFDGHASKLENVVQRSDGQLDEKKKPGIHSRKQKAIDDAKELREKAKMLSDLTIYRPRRNLAQYLKTFPECRDKNVDFIGMATRKYRRDRLRQ